MIAINRPIPAVIANLRFEGILFTRASLNLNSESNINMIPSINTAVNATL